MTHTLALAAALILAAATADAQARIDRGAAVGDALEFDGQTVGWDLVNRIAPERVIAHGRTRGAHQGELWLIVARGADLFYYHLADIPTDREGPGAYAGYVVRARQKIETVFDHTGAGSLFANQTIPYWSHTLTLAVNFAPERFGDALTPLDERSGLTRLTVARTDISMRSSGGRFVHVETRDAQGDIVHQGGMVAVADSIDWSGPTVDCTAAGKAAAAETSQYLDEVALAPIDAYDAILQSEYGAAGVAGFLGAAAGAATGTPVLGEAVGGMASALIVDAQVAVNAANRNFQHSVLEAIARDLAVADCVNNGKPEGSPSIDAGSLGLDRNPVDLPDPDTMPVPQCDLWSTGFETVEENDEGGFDVTWNRPKCLRYGVVWVPVF